MLIVLLPFYLQKIADFGHSAEASGPKDEGFSCVAGTNSYMAPEVLAGRVGYAGPPADIWSCGIILFLLLLGHVSHDHPCTSVCTRVCTHALYVCAYTARLRTARTL